MNDTPKKLKSKNLVKDAIFKSNGISRKEIALHSDLDVRTASAYVDELLRLGLVVEKKEYPDGKGRPVAKYFSNAANCHYIGVHLTKNILARAVSDADGNILSVEREEFPLGGETKLKTVNRILSVIEKGVESLPEGKKMCGVGVAVSRWLRPPLSNFDLVSDLAEIIGRATGLPVFSGLPISVLLFRELARSPERRDTMLVHPGMVLELGFVRDGVIPPDADRLEKSFSHVCVDEAGMECYCGKRGCLENYATLAGMNELFKAESASRGGGVSAEGFEDALRNGAPAAMAVAEKVALLLARGIVGFARENHVGRVRMAFPCETLVEMTGRRVGDLSKGAVEFCGWTTRANDVVESAALMAMFSVTKNLVDR